MMRKQPDEFDAMSTPSAEDLISEYDFGVELTDRILAIAAAAHKAGYERGHADATTALLADADKPR